MPFDNHYVNLVTERTQAHTRLIRDYDGANPDFDFIVIGSGMGGGILADDLADRLGEQRRILVLDVGSFVYPTHVYNVSRIPNFSVAEHFGADNFRPYPDNRFYIGGKPQLTFGGARSSGRASSPRCKAGSSTTFRRACGRRSRASSCSSPAST